MGGERHSSPRVELDQQLNLTYRGATISAELPACPESDDRLGLAQMGVKALPCSAR